MHSGGGPSGPSGPSGPTGPAQPEPTRPEVVWLEFSTAAPWSPPPGKRPGANGFTMADVQRWVQERAATAAAVAAPVPVAESGGAEGGQGHKREPVHHRVELHEEVQVREQVGTAHSHVESERPAAPSSGAASSSSPPRSHGATGGGGRRGAAVAPNKAVVWDETQSALLVAMTRFVENGFSLGEMPVQQIAGVWFAWLDGPAGIDARNLQWLLGPGHGGNGPGGVSPAAVPPEPVLEVFGFDGAYGPQFGPIVLDDDIPAAEVHLPRPAPQTAILTCTTCNELFEPADAICGSCVKRAIAELLRLMMDAGSRPN